MIIETIYDIRLWLNQFHMVKYSAQEACTICIGELCLNYLNFTVVFNKTNNPFIRAVQRSDVNPRLNARVMITGDGSFQNLEHKILTRF